MPATQPISLTSESATARPDADVARADLSLVPKSEPSPAIRRHLPDERRALTHHFSIAGQEGYLTVGVYEDGLPGEIFITMAKQGSTISGLMDSLPQRYPWRCRTACRSKFCAASSRILALSPAAGPEIPGSATPSP